MCKLNKLNFYNLTDLIYQKPKPIDSNKSLAMIIAFSILSLGIIPLVMGIKWGVDKAVTWIHAKFSETDQKTQAVAQTHLMPNGPTIIKEAFRYQKEAKNVPHIIPKNKDKVLGQGVNGKVYEHRYNPELAIKVVADAHEYEIGAMLNHPVLAKSHELFIKEYPGSKPDKYKLVVEKVDGKKLTSFQQSADSIPKEIGVKLIKQAKEFCIYLFQSGVYWKDVNDGNIFIENNTNNLRIIDLGYWNKESNSKERVKHLLLGAMELTTWVVGNSSCIKTNGVKDREKKKEIAFPKNFFNEQIADNQIFSLYSDFDTSWMQKIAAKLEVINENQMEGFISSYFDHVITNFESA